MRVKIHSPFLCFTQPLEFYIQEGRFNIFFGPSGSGKSLLLGTLKTLIDGNNILKCLPVPEGVKSGAYLYTDTDKLLTSIESPTDYRPPTIRKSNTPLSKKGKALQTLISPEIKITSLPYSDSLQFPMGVTHFRDVLDKFKYYLGLDGDYKIIVDKNTSSVSLVNANLMGGLPMPSTFDWVLRLLQAPTLAAWRLKSHPEHLEGVYFIENIENGFDVEMQGNIMGALKAVFPSLSFIVTTSSPFVLRSKAEDDLCYKLEDSILTPYVFRPQEPITKSLSSLGISNRHPSYQVLWDDLLARVHRSYTMEERNNVVNEMRSVFGGDDEEILKMEWDFYSKPK
jgi:hypothetical protein